VTASHLRQLASVVGLLVLWQLLVQTGKLSELFLPAPLSVLASMWEMTRSGQLPWAVLVSLNRVLQGFVYGAAAGIVLGLLAGAVGWIEDVLDPWVAAVYPIPKSALFPLFLLWFGLGDASKIATIAIGVLFLVLVNTITGVRSISLSTPRHAEGVRGRGHLRSARRRHHLAPPVAGAGGVPLAPTIELKEFSHGAEPPGLPRSGEAVQA